MAQKKQTNKEKTLISLSAHCIKDVHAFNLPNNPQRSRLVGGWRCNTQWLFFKPALLWRVGTSDGPKIMSSYSVLHRYTSNVCLAKRSQYSIHKKTFYPKPRFWRPYYVVSNFYMESWKENWCWKWVTAYLLQSEIMLRLTLVVSLSPESRWCNKCFG